MKHFRRKSNRARSLWAFFCAAVVLALTVWLVVKVIWPAFFSDSDDVASFAFYADNASVSSPFIISPFNGFRYFSDAVLCLDQALGQHQGQLYLDGQEIPWATLQRLEIEDGKHQIDLYLNEKKLETTVFEMCAEETTTLHKETILNFPRKITLPKVEGSMTPVRIRLTNTSQESAENVFLRTADQPDLRSVTALQMWLIEQTRGQTERDKALYLLDFIKSRTQFSVPPVVGENSWQNDALPDFLRDWGYGWCEDMVKVFIQLAMLVGWQAKDTRVHSLGDHFVAELKFNDDWHLFDPTTLSYYWDSRGNIFSLQDVQGGNAEVILNYTDQGGRTERGFFLRSVLGSFKKGSNQQSQYYNPRKGSEGGFILESGDVIDLYPFGNFPHQNKESLIDKLAVIGHGVWSRRLPFPTAGSLAIFNHAFPFVGLTADVQAETPGLVEFRLVIQGRIKKKEVTFQTSLDKRSLVDFTRYFNPQELGTIRSFELFLMKAESEITKISLEAHFQYAARMTPRITPDNRTLIIDGSAQELMVEIDVHNRKQEVFYATTIVQWADNEENLTVKNDGKDKLAISAFVIDENKRPSSGNKVELISDHPDQIVVELNPFLDLMRYKPIISPWIGPDRFLGREGYLYCVFFVSSKQSYPYSLGPVRFTLLVNGKPRAHKTVSFTKPESE